MIAIRQSEYISGGHLMHKKIGFFLVSLLYFGSFHAGAEKALLKVCIISGSAEYETHKFLPQYKEYLEDRYNIKATLLQCTDTEKPGNDIPGLEALDDCDVALIYTRRLEIGGEQLERVKRYALSGRPIVAVRTASHGFQKFLEFDKEVLGGNYHGHFGGSSRGDLTAPTQRAEVAEDAKDHPVVRGVSVIKSRYSLYKTAPVAEDVHVLMWSSIPGEEKQPAAWVRQYKGGRIFYTSLGGIQDFENATFQRMIAQALFWTAGRETEAKELPAPSRRTKPTGTFCVPLRTRVETFKGSNVWDEVIVEQEFPIAETAILICDMWDKHWCQGASERCEELAKRMDLVLKAARDRGIQIIHAPSETMTFYADWPQRWRMTLAPAVPTPKPLDLAQHPLPIDDSDGGCDTDEKPWYEAWTRQSPYIEIGEYDGISDSGQEIYNFFTQEGINNLIIIGVHTNMCVLGRSFGIRQMTRWGVRCILVRDLTDAMYDPKDRPFVSHDEGTQLVVQHIEKYWCPSILSSELLDGLP